MSTAAASDALDHPVVLFDGVCNLCNRSVLFLIDHDPAAKFRFAAQQSPVGQELLAQFGVPTSAETADSIVLIESGRAFRDSTAVLRIVAGLGGPWRLLGGLRIVPRPIRDLAYRFLATHRYRWFGRTEACRIPTPELRSRFLDAAVPG
jgi:predicted DCC family thiol-disulfide oxidoreductase YuxK